MRNPNNFDELVFELPENKQILSDYACGKLTGNILLYGPFGTGKSTTARIVAEHVHAAANSIFVCAPTIINGASFVDSDLKQIVNSWGMAGGSYTYAVIDEFDRLSGSNLAKLRALMDKYDNKFGVIITTNNLHLIDPAIVSRCKTLEMQNLSTQTLLPICRASLDDEGVLLDDDDIKTLIQPANGDIREVRRQVDALIAKLDRSAA